MGIKISELPQASQLTSDDLIPIVQSGETKKIGISNVIKNSHNTSENASYSCEYINQKLDNMFPIGAVYFTVTNTNPGTFLTGTWVRIAKGKTIVGVDEDDTDFNTAEKTGGEKTHTLTIDEMPSHNHTWEGGLADGAGVNDYPRRSVSHEYSNFINGINNTGGGQAHNNLQPYFTCYIWKRTA